MDNTNKHFKGQFQYEEVICTFRRHWVVLLPYLIGFFIVFFLFVLIVSVDFRGNFPSADSVWHSQAIFFFATILCVWLLHRFFLRLFHYYLKVVIITNYRIVNIDKSVFFKDDQDAFDLNMIADVKKYSSGILETIFNYGVLEFSLPSMNIVKKIHFVPAPNHYFRCIGTAKQNFEQAKRREYF